METQPIILKLGDIVILDGDEKDIEWIVMDIAPGGHHLVDRLTQNTPHFIAHGTKVFHFPKPQTLDWIFMLRREHNKKLIEKKIGG